MNELRMRQQSVMYFADTRGAAVQQNELAEDLAASFAASAKNLKPGFQPPTFQCLAAFYESKSFLASQGEGRFGVEFGCGLTYLFCMAERVIPLAGG